MITTTLLIVLIVNCVESISFNYNEVQNLRGQPGNRSVILTWSYFGDKRMLSGFKVEFKEIDIWSRRYSERALLFDHSRAFTSDVLVSDGPNFYRGTIVNLRASTKYEMSVKPINAQQNIDVIPKGPAVPNNVEVSTLPYTAEVISCGSTETVIRVTTGKGFRGKIGVDRSNEKECYLVSNGQNTGQTVDFKFNYDKCGVKKTGSSRVSKVLVQEIAIVMTASDRMFVVNCSLAPIPLTVSASINMPIGKEDPNDHSINDISNAIHDDKFTYQKYKDSNNRKSRILADQDAFGSSRPIYRNVIESESGTHAGKSLVIAFFVIATIFGILGATYWIISYSKKSGQKITELPDGFQKANVIILRNDDIVGKSGVIASTANEVSLVSVKNISEA